MNKRSYLDTLNAGRQRKPHTSIEELNRSLETLEQRLERGRASPPEQNVRSDEERDYNRRMQRLQSETAYREPTADERSYAARNRAQAPRASAPEQNYQSLARDIDRVRGQEDGIAAAGKIAGELKSLREELRHQMTSGLRREFDSLRKDIERAYTTSSVSSKGGAELGAEFERLSGAIHALAERSDDKSINMLRLELEQVKGAIGSLAREDTVRSTDRRWDEFDRRWTTFEDRYAADNQAGAVDPALAALNSRLEQINQAVNSLPESLSLLSLEDKVRTLAGAVDHFARQQDKGGSEAFGVIEERLDEISRAIVASSVSMQAPLFDPEPLERIEARIASLSRQIEEAAEEQPSSEVIDRLNMLSQRVDEIAARGSLPEKAMERLAKQVSVIADKLDATPPVPNNDHLFQGLDQRFDMLSDMLDRRQGDAFEHGQTLFRDLERRLEDVTTRIDERAPDVTFDSSEIMNAIDLRFNDLARRLENRPAPAADDGAIRSLETRLEDISHRLETSVAHVESIDPDLIRNLEAQVAGLTEHLSRPSAPFPEFEDMGPRLDVIERSIAGNRDSLLEAARLAAENAVHSFSGSQADTAAVAGLATDLKSLEALTRRSDDRNTKTFEAIHDTLLKIVERLGSLEESTLAGQAVPAAPVRKISAQNTPSMDLAGHETLDSRLDDFAFSDTPIADTPVQTTKGSAMSALSSATPASAEAAGRKRSMLGGLTRAFSGNKDRNEPVLAGSDTFTPDVDMPRMDLDEPLDPKIANRPLEPGSGAPDLNAIMKRVRDERGQTPRQNDAETSKSDFIAAARRAAQAAAAEAETMKRNSVIPGPVRALKIGDLLRARRKPVLMAAAAILIALAGLQLGKAFMASDNEVASNDPAPMVVEKPVQMAGMEQMPASKSNMPASSNEEASSVRAAGEPAQAPASETTRDGPFTEAAPQLPDVAQASTPKPEISDAETGPVASTEPAAAAAATPGDKAPVDAGPVPLREAADAGDAKAIFEIGSRYADGRGTKADMTKAAKWYEKSAELGLAPGQYRIGNFYEKGIGVTKDITKAKTWYQLAAEQGNASAMHNLAVLYAMGADGVTDNESAARWFVNAAELGVKDSQFNLGILAAKGVGMTQSLEESYKWFALVAKTGDRDAAAKRDEIANAMRPEQLEKARAATELWKPKPVDAATNIVEIPDAWKESNTKTASIDMKKAVQNIQAILNKNGYDAGKPDGMMGQKTKNAIAKFQKDNGMDATGEVDEKLVRALLERK